MNYIELFQNIQNYAENTEALFVSSIPTFVKEAEARIYNSVQLPSLRKNVTGAVTANNPYLSLPDDYLSSFSVAVIDSAGAYQYLLNKDVNFIREAYPAPNNLGTPKYYGLFGSQFSDVNEMSYIVGPTPDQSYDVELHYFYYPPTIVQGQIKALGNISNGGSAYISGAYSNIPLNGGSGANATATFLVVGGIVTQVTLNSGGSLYAVGDVLTVSNTYLGGAGSGFSIPVSTISNATGRSWLGDNYDPVLFYGAMREANLFMKGEQDMVAYYEQKYQEALGQLNRLGTGLERGDSYRNGQARFTPNP